jgi:hypothetical protein
MTGRTFQLALMAGNAVFRRSIDCQRRRIDPARALPQGNDLAFPDFNVGQLTLPGRQHHPVSNRVILPSITVRKADNAIVRIGDFGDKRTRIGVSVAGFTTNFDGFVLFRINVAVTHDIKLRMAVNALESSRKMNILPNFPETGK